jgi:hypothetical protein
LRDEIKTIDQLEHLILEDLKIYAPSSKSDIHLRIGVEIHEKKVKRSIDKLGDEEKIIECPITCPIEYMIENNYEPIT